MKLILAIGFLQILGFIQIQANKKCQPPVLTGGQTWYPNQGCKHPRGNTWFNMDDEGTRCYYWNDCGYICEPNPCGQATVPTGRPVTGNYWSSDTTNGLPMTT